MQPLNTSILLNIPFSHVFRVTSAGEELRLATAMEAGRFAVEQLKVLQFEWGGKGGLVGDSLDTDLQARYAEMLARKTFPAKDLAQLSAVEFFEYTQLMRDHKVGDEAGLVLCAARIIMACGYPNPLNLLRTYSDNGRIDHLSLEVVAVTDRPEDACELNPGLSLLPEEEQYFYFGAKLDASIDNPSCFCQPRWPDNLFVACNITDAQNGMVDVATAMPTGPGNRHLLRASELPFPIIRSVIAPMRTDAQGHLLYGESQRRFAGSS